MLLYIYIAPGQGRQPLRTHVEVNIKPLSLCTLIASLTTISLILYMCIAPGQGQTTPWRQNFDVNRNSLSLCPFVASLKRISFKSDFYRFYVFCHMYISPGRARQPIGDKQFMTTESIFSFHMLQVSKWSLRSLILYTFLMTLYMYIAP